MAPGVSPLRPRLRSRLAASAVALVALAGCAGATPPPAPPPDPAPADATPPPEPAVPSAAPEAAQAPDAPPPAASAAAKDDSIPDAYEMSNGDCATLAKQLGDLTRSDQRAGLSKQLSDKQRSAADKSIDSAAAQIQDRWVTMCQGSLVGKVVDPKSLKCALDAKTVKEFDVCLNGDSAPKPPK